MEQHVNHIMDLVDKHAGDCPLTLKTIKLVGLVYLAYRALGVLSTVLQFLWRWYIRPARLFTLHGKWAIVTGATDGIGRAYAFELAKAKLNVVLVSRTEAKLQAVKKDIKAKYPKVIVDYVVADFVDEDDTPLYTKLGEMVARYENDGGIAVLVNNVGMSYRYAQYFHEISEAEIQDMIKINVTSAARMTHLVLRDMYNRKKGFVVNISSGSGLSPTGGLALYAGTKGMVNMFSQSVDHEMAGKVSVQSVAPFMVASKLSKMRPSTIVPSPSQFAAYAVAQIGYERETYGHPFFEMQGGFQKLFSGLYESLVLKFHMSIRKRGMKKDARVAAEKKSM